MRSISTCSRALARPSARCIARTKIPVGRNRRPWCALALSWWRADTMPTRSAGPMPGWSDSGKIVHSADYRNAKPFAGQSVLVIGMGNTGAEIALDLAEGGARPTISVRNGVHIVPRELFGLPIQLVAMLATKLLPLKANDALSRRFWIWPLAIFPGSASSGRYRESCNKSATSLKFRSSMSARFERFAKTRSG